jgi:hypothetical protein
VPYSIDPLWFDAQPSQKDVPLSFEPLRSISLEIYGINQAFEVTAVLIDRDGHLQEAPMGTGDFSGHKTLFWHFPLGKRPPNLAFKELRIYWDPSKQLDGYLPLEAHIGQLTINDGNSNEG